MWPTLSPDIIKWAWISTYSFLALLTLYVVGAIIFLLQVKINKDEYERLIIEVHSWHSILLYNIHGEPIYERSLNLSVITPPYSGL